MDVVLPVPAPGNYNAGTRIITWNIGSVPALSAPASVNFSAVVSESVTSDMDVTNIAHSTNNEDPGDVPSNTTNVTVDVPSLQLTPVANVPNPAVEETTIIFWISVRAEVTIKFYTISGEPIRTMTYDQVKANLTGASDINRGDNRVKWDLKNNSKKLVSTGVYFYKVEAKTASGEKAHFISKLAVLR